MSRYHRTPLAPAFEAYSPSQLHLRRESRTVRSRWTVAHRCTEIIGSLIGTGNDGNLCECSFVFQCFSVSSDSCNSCIQRYPTRTRESIKHRLKSSAQLHMAFDMPRSSYFRVHESEPQVFPQVVQSRCPRRARPR